jgi:DNA gyrase subunit A
VIVGRALPDVRDGLKPVHRRILFAMHELGLTPDRPFRKCARVVGDVLGKYHPHGDQSVYDALVRLVQDFSSRYPLLGGHGNFGSVDNDPPAAMRYTETRLSAIGYGAVLGEVGTATVDFIGNFDNSQQEPTVLPAEFPLLLVNGCSGIAVGMATNVPPHNLGEIIDGLIALIDNPNLPDRELWTIIPGPDFPTGGEILGNEGICEAYRSGKGIIPVRGVVHLETAQQAKQIKSRKRRDALVVTELPFQVNKAGLIERIAELVNNSKIDGIADLRDESDREGMRIVIEIKRDSDAQKVLAALYKQTALQSNFGAIFLALVDNLPRQLSLREALQEFLKFREETLTRQYSNDLQQFQQRAHLVMGLLTALENLDQVIDILRNAPDGSTAKGQLIDRLELSTEQADAILAMPMRRLTGLERHNLAKEGEELNEKIAKLEKLLGDRKELLKSMKKDLRALKKQHADERRTKIIDFQPPESFVPKVVVPRTPATAVADGIGRSNYRRIRCSRR